MGLHHFYEEMRIKYGWNDGEFAPIGVDEARDELVKLINSKLPEDCPVEAYGYDRPGTHNCHLLLYKLRGAKPTDTDGYCGEEEEPEEIGDILWDAEENDELYIVLSCEVES